MENNKLFEIWEKGNDSLDKAKITRSQIAGFLKNKINKVSRVFYFNIVFYMILHLAIIILASMNLVGYASNPIILWLLVGSLAFSLAGLAYGTIILYKFKEINNYSDTLTSLIDKQLGFLSTYYEIWLLLISFSVLALIFNVNIMVDYTDGHYPIYHKGFFIIVNVAVFTSIYIAQKVSGLLLTRSLKAYLHDLRNGLLEQSAIVEKSKRKLKWFFIILGIIFTATSILGLLKFLQAGQ